MDIYVNLKYAEYKALEQQLRDLDRCETSHTSVDGFYHKSISFLVDGVRFEFHGPNVKAAEEEAEYSYMKAFGEAVEVCTNCSAEQCPICFKCILCCNC